MCLCQLLPLVCLCQPMPLVCLCQLLPLMCLCQPLPLMCLCQPLPLVCLCQPPPLVCLCQPPPLMCHFTACDKISQTFLLHIYLPEAIKYGGRKDLVLSIGPTFLRAGHKTSKDLGVKRPVLHAQRFVVYCSSKFVLSHVNLDLSESLSVCTYMYIYD